MGNVEKISLELSNKLGERLKKTDEEKRVLNYGLFVVLHTAMGMLITLIVGIVSGMPLEIMVITITVGWFKRYSGGGHASTPERCTIIGVLLAFILAILSIKLNEFLDIKSLIAFAVIILIFCYYTLYKKCPVSSKNKQFKSESSRIRIRKKAFKLANAYSMFIFILIILYSRFENNMAGTCATSILLAITLQMLVLTDGGIKFIKVLDQLFDITIFK